MELTDRELQVITQGATNAFSAQREFIPLSDLINEGVLWALQNERKVMMWRDKGKYGINLLRHSVKQACLSLIAKERRRIYRLERDDVAYYNPGMVREILPDIFDVDDWISGSSAVDTERVKGTSRPSEGNTRLVTVIDVKGAFDALNQEDQVFLHDLYADGGLTHQVLAATLDVSEKTIQRREQRLIQKIVDKLGGELPWFDKKRSA